MIEREGTNIMKPLKGALLANILPTMTESLVITSFSNINHQVSFPFREITLK
jgi:hypothetical protein